MREIVAHGGAGSRRGCSPCQRCDLVFRAQFKIKESYGDTCRTQQQTTAKLARSAGGRVLGMRV